MAIAMERAPGVSAAVVDIALFGAKDLCIRPRADPLTAQIPLVFVVNHSNDAVGVPVDAAVPLDTMDVLDQTLRLYCPSLARVEQLEPAAALSAAPVPAEDDEVFDDSSKTVVFRRPMAQPGEALEWPPLPPSIEPNQDMVDYTQSYAGYMNSLMEALNEPSKLSNAELKRLQEVSKATMDDVEVLLGAVQTSINEALMDKDLVRMRVLSTAKNTIYDKRQTIRGMLGKAGTAKMPTVEMTAPDPEPPTRRETQPPPAAAEPKAPRPKRNTLEFGSKEVPPVPPGPPAPPAEEGPGDTADEMLSLMPDSNSSTPGAITKSELTLAAEAKVAERKATRRAEVVAARKAAKKGRKPASKPGGKKAVYGSAAKGGKPGYGWVWIPIAALLVLVSGFYLVVHFRNMPDKSVVKKVKNDAPEMEWVILDQSTAGVQARVSAKDKEKNSISYSIRWFVNNQQVKGQHTTRLQPTHFRTGDIVYVEVTPTDMYNSGLPMRSRELQTKVLARKR